MRLRAFALILPLTLALLAAPVLAEAQNSERVYRIGWLAEASKGAVANLWQITGGLKTEGDGHG